MNPSYLAPLTHSLSRLGQYAEQHDITDATLTEIAAELDRARSLVTECRGDRRANTCLRHPGGPYDPTAPNGCLLCWQLQARPVAVPVPEGTDLADVLACVEREGQEAAVRRHGARAVTRALALGAGHPSAQQRLDPRDQHDRHDRPNDDAGEMH